MVTSAPLFVWADLSERDLQLVRQAGLDSAEATAGLQTAAATAHAKTDVQTAIELDLYRQTLTQAQELALTSKQASALFSIVKAVHNESISMRLTIDRSFDCFKQVLLRHSVHRPPYSLGLFTLPQAHAITEWLLGSYFMHYKLYQYAFTKRVTCTVQSGHPGDVVELAPQLPPLQDGATEEQHQVSVAEQDKQDAEAAAKAAEDKAAQDELDRQQHIKDSYAAQMPDEISQKVQAALQQEMDRLQLIMSAQFAKQEAALKLRVAELEQKATTAGVA